MLEAYYPPTHLAELRAAFGTVELSAGSARRGRQLLREFEDPPKTPLLKLSGRIEGCMMPTRLLGTCQTISRVCSRRWHYVRHTTLDGLMVSRTAKRGRQDQPFRVEPYIQGSYCASASHRNKRGISLEMDSCYIQVILIC